MFFGFFGGAFISVPMQGGNVERMACVNARGNAPMCLEVFANASLVDAACFQEQGLSFAQIEACSKEQRIQVHV